MTGPRLLPRRTAGLEVAEFEVEFVVYDPATQQVHHLRELTAVVFDACDGATTWDDVRADLAEAMAVPADRAAELLADTVELLATAGLVGHGASATPDPARGKLGADE